MKRERRSYYRILYVQPEAPPEVIRASYRSLMTTLKMHPDLGGDHDAAVAINQAYAVLNNPEKRRAYDASRKGTQKRESVPAPRPATATATAPGCPFCGHATPRTIARDSHCQCCSSPLASIAARFDGKRETTGRRSAMRIARKESATVQLAWNRQPASALLRDFSSAGVSFYTALAIGTGSRLRLTTPHIDLVAEVIDVRSQDRIYLVRATILTARFADQQGVFVSVAV